MGILRKAFDKFIDAMRLPEDLDDDCIDTCNHCDDTSNAESLDDDSNDDYIDTCNDCADTSNAEILSAVMKDNEIIGISVIDPDGHSKFLLCGQHNSVLEKKACSLSTTKNPKSAT